MNTDSCVFCDLDRIANPAEVIHCGITGVACRVFEPLNPVTAGHLLVIPVPHVTHAAESPFAAAAAMSVAARVAARHPSANIITSIGAAATQTVGHLHLHVVPRRPGDDLHLPWTGQQVSQTSS